MLSPFVNDSDFQLYVGDVLDVLKQLPDKHVHCIVTSPPYWGLRDYGTATWKGGDSACDHLMPVGGAGKSTLNTGTAHSARRSQETQRTPYREKCGRCGAVRVDQQIGLEATPQEYVAKMVTVFAEARRVLRDDGTLWLNLGDTYASNWGLGARRGSSWWSTGSGDQEGKGWGEVVTALPPNQFRGLRPDGLKVKDLCGIPWRVAFALQQSGWVLRRDIIWFKKNAMPESVSDRPSTDHEYIFMFAKAKRTSGIEPLLISKEDAIWLAALVDGEGSICFDIRKTDGHVSPRLSISNTNRDLLARVIQITNILGASNTPSPRIRSTGESGRPVFSWQVTNKKAASVIAAIRPYLIAKSKQADLALFVHVLNQKHKGRGNPSTGEDQAPKRKAAEACSALNHGKGVDLSWLPSPVIAHWKSQPYYFDQDSIREPYHYDGRRATRVQGGPGSAQHRNGERWPGIGKHHHASRSATSHHGHDETEPMEIGAIGRNKRSVWEVSTKSYPEAHFAVYPEELIEPCIKAGCPEGGTVLDLFIGSGTTCCVARRLGRKTIGIELNPEYAELCAKRTRQLSLLG